MCGQRISIFGSDDARRRGAHFRPLYARRSWPRDRAALALQRPHVHTRGGSARPQRKRIGAPPLALDMLEGERSRVHGGLFDRVTLPPRVGRVARTRSHCLRRKLPPRNRSFRSANPSRRARTRGEGLVRAYVCVLERRAVTRATETIASPSCAHAAGTVARTGYVCAQTPSRRFLLFLSLYLWIYLSFCSSLFYV